MSTLLLIIIYFAAVNLLGFISMGIDKSRAKKHEWRISEATLFLFALIGGALGSFLGMRVFRHKTKHWYFVWGIPLIMIIWIVLIVLFLSGKIVPVTIW